MLKVENLTIRFDTRYGPLTAVDDVTFEVRPGEVFGLVGESGAGKSLTGQSIIGLLDPPGYIAGGQITLEGTRIDNLAYNHLRALRGRKIGMIFQDPLTSLNPLYTIGKQLTETILTHSSMTNAEAQKQAIALLTDVGIPGAGERINCYPHQFSGGMRQRVVIALALCVNPQLVIADEPTTALDVSIQAQILSLLKRMCREHGAAVILITHDMGVIAQVAQRVAVMYSGRLVEIGDVRQVVKHPQHPYARGLMGSIPSLHHQVDQLTQIDGTMPRLTDIPSGCAFHPRCPDCFDLCKDKRPPLKKIADSHIACWLYANEAHHAG
ncbi:ABC transporter ATP-binding protein [Desulfococcaceae bacterium HSG9]|nr:ABC transporter ATP-binding protein [Desulfococcaceae bacterium HSG9]